MKIPGHQNLFNGDCDIHFYQAPWNHWRPKKGGRHSVKAVHHMVDLLARSGVDTYLVNPNGQRAYYPSKVAPTHMDGYKRGDRKFLYAHILGQPMTRAQSEAYLDNLTRFMDRYLDLLEDGVDWLAETSKACRRRKISPWLSVRMNDMHGANSFEGSYMNAPLLADPKHRLRGTTLNPKEGTHFTMMALNFESREVRDYMMRMIRELVEDYDFEGMELDWTRTYYCCNPVASKQTTEMITRWHADIRALTQRRAKRTGRPYPLGLRVPGHFEVLRAYGLDVREMINRGLIDFLCPTATWQTTWNMPHDNFKKEFGDRVAIYGVVEDGPNWVGGYAPKTKERGFIRYMAASAPLLRGNAAGKLVLGADGIETFNFFCTDQWESAGGDYKALRGLEDLKSLRGKPKQYTFGTGPACWVETHFEFPLQLPCILEPQWQRQFQLAMCSEPAHARLKLTIQVVVEKGDKAPDLGVTFNHSWPNYKAQPTQKLLFPVGPLTEHLPECQAFNYSFNAGDIREGWNEIGIVNGSRQRDNAQQRKENSVNIASIELAVR